MRPEQNLLNLNKSLISHKREATIQEIEPRSDRSGYNY